MADDLDDDFWVKEDIGDDLDVGEKECVETPVAVSPPEGRASNKLKKKKKRKLKDLTNENTVEEQQSPAKKAKKKKKKKKMHQEEVDDLPPDVTSLWNFFESELDKSLSKIEIEDLKPENDDCFLIEDTSIPTIKNTTENVSSYLQNVIPDWEMECSRLTKKEYKSSPLLLIITLSAIRAVDVLRATSAFRGEKCKTMKLFAKHMKVDEQLDRLKKNIVHLGVGTPNRIFKLVEEGGININRLKYVVIDWSWKDMKQRRISTMPGVKDELIILFQKHLLPRCRINKLHVGIF